MTEESGGDVDCLFSILAHTRRRHALACLLDQAGQLPIAALASEIVDREQTSSGTVDDEEVEKVTIALYHAHLPKLEAAGLVRLDETRKVVVPTERIESVEPLLPDRCEQ